MKKLPKGYLLRQKRIEHALLKRKSKQRVRRRASPFIRNSGHERIHAPECLALLPEHADRVIRFVHELERKAVAAQKIVIDFSKTELVHALGAVYLYSEIDRARMNRAVIRVQGMSNNLQVFDALRITGILAVCSHPALPDSAHIPVIRGKDDNHLPMIIEYLMNTALVQKQLNIKDSDYAESLVNKAISEAMLNVKQHAYPQNEANDFWWATATIFGNSLHIALCDRGVGIPKTLKDKNWFKKAWATLKSDSSDAAMIKAAMEYTRSSREGHGGGLGSHDIQQLVLGAHEGHLTIISGKGYYCLRGKNNDQIAQKIGYDVAGTLIHWQIPLHRQSEAHYERAHN
ncbi:MAG: hypothetical protein OXU50_03990 [Gammaproteobacteria bacterium]|nr:hypothetical protein [Gammaproteobacteria bacterium]